MFVLYRILITLLVGVPLIFYSGHVFGQYVWPQLFYPVAPSVLVHKLPMATAIGFALFMAWLQLGLVRLILDRTPDPEEELSNENKLTKQLVNYLISFILTSVFWGVTILFF